jgi:hypothetical protein
VGKYLLDICAELVNMFRKSTTVVNAQIKNAFEIAEFIVVETAFRNLSLPDNVRQAVLERNGTSPVANLLCAYPDLFIFPRKLTAAQGCIFGITTPGGKPLSASRLAALQKHFPTERTAVFSESPKGILAVWLNDGAKSVKPLGEFISTLG